jgi:hypothetical protein
MYSMLTAMLALGLLLAGVGAITWAVACLDPTPQTPPPLTPEEREWEDRALW